MQPCPVGFLGGGFCADFMRAAHMFSFWSDFLTSGIPIARLPYSRLGKRTSQHLTLVAKAQTSRHSHSHLTWRHSHLPAKEVNMQAFPSRQEWHAMRQTLFIRRSENCCKLKRRAYSPVRSVFWVGDFVQILCGRRTCFHFGPIF